MNVQSTSDLIDAIHRGNEGSITFHAKPSPNSKMFEAVGAVPARDLKKRFAEFAGALERDGYFSVNAFHGQRRLVSRVSHLTACFVDFDCYRAGIEPNEAMKQFMDAGDSGAIPSVSLFAKSGRGLWSFWLLDDDERPGTPLRATPQLSRLYSRVQNAIAAQFSHFHPDARAINTCGRVPESVNGKVDARVRYVAQYDDRLRMPSYRLSHLAAAFGAATETPKPLTQNPVLAGRFNIGQRVMYEKRLAQFKRLQALRGGFSEGCRNNAAVVLASTLRGLRLDFVAACDEMLDFARECNPPLSDSEVLAPLRCVWNWGFNEMTNERIANDLDVTTPEAAQLETWPSATRFGTVQNLLVATRSERAVARRALIGDLIGKGGGELLPTRRMAELLQEHGHSVSHATVSSDYRHMGYLDVNAYELN